MNTVTSTAITAIITLLVGAIFGWFGSTINQAASPKVEAFVSVHSVVLPDEAADKLRGVHEYCSNVDVTPTINRLISDVCTYGRLTTFQARIVNNTSKAVSAVLYVPEEWYMTEEPSKGVVAGSSINVETIPPHSERVVYGAGTSYVRTYSSVGDFKATANGEAIDVLPAAFDGFDPSVAAYRFISANWYWIFPLAGFGALTLLAVAGVWVLTLLGKEYEFSSEKELQAQFDKISAALAKKRGGHPRISPPEDPPVAAG